MRWLFADQLGPSFVADLGPDQQVLLVESRAALRRRHSHRAKAHLLLSALRHRAAELGERVRFVQAETYREALAQVEGPVEVVHPTSREALALVRSLGCTVLPPRGFITTFAEFQQFAESRRTLRMEDFYRAARRRTGVLMEAGEPVGGRWNFDAENRQPPPRGATTLGAPEPWWPHEDAVDAQVRADLDSWGIGTVGLDGPRRFAVTAAEARAALDRFLAERLPRFGAHEDAMLRADPWMAHSLLSVPLNLGLLDPLDVVRRAAAADAPLASREGFIRQILGWRDYVWHVYWWSGEAYEQRNALGAAQPLPDWFAGLDADAVQAACLSSALASVRDHGWAHHIERLMVLGSWALQRGYEPAALLEWFRASFVDGFAWVMGPNVIGMSQFADGGLLATKPYTSGGAYLDRMSDHCRTCRYSPRTRTGPDACPFTAGYWAFLEHADRTGALAGNHRMAQPLASMRRLADLPTVVAQEAARGPGPP
jgi:deoxyribodipyrimidine photolyase-related protein